MTGARSGASPSRLLIRADVLGTIANARPAAFHRQGRRHGRDLQGPSSRSACRIGQTLRRRRSPWSSRWRRCCPPTRAAPVAAGAIASVPYLVLISPRRSSNSRTLIPRYGGRLRRLIHHLRHAVLGQARVATPRPSRREPVRDPLVLAFNTHLWGRVVRCCSRAHSCSVKPYMFEVILILWCLTVAFLRRCSRRSSGRRWSPYQRRRLVVFIDPRFRIRGWPATMSFNRQIAMASGGWMAGFTMGTQIAPSAFLPEQQHCFSFAVV